MQRPTVHAAQPRVLPAVSVSVGRGFMCTTPPSIAAAQLQPVVPPPPPKTKNHMLFLTFAIDPLHCSCCTRAPVTSARQSPRRSLYCVGILTHRSQLRKTALPRTRTTASSDASRRPARRCDCRWGFKRALRRERAACAMQRALSTHCKKPAYGRQSEGLRTMSVTLDTNTTAALTPICFCLSSQNCGKKTSKLSLMIKVSGAGR